MSDRTEPDFTEFEHHKENITSLPYGRKSSNISSVSKDTAQANHARSLQTKNAQIEQLRLSKLVNKLDPLEPLVTYISWMEAAFPSGHVDISATIEKAARDFRKDARYKNDARYVELWMKVIATTKDPIEVCKYLSINEIGGELAMYYVKYASLLEYRQKWTEAEEVFVTGLANHAHPIDKLQSLHRSFLARKNEWLKTRVAPVQARPAATQKLSATPKMSVYKDVAANDLRYQPLREEGQMWNDIDSLDEARKENKALARSLNVNAVNADNENLKTKHKKDVKEILVCDLSLIYIADDEYSFEEIRAIRSGYQLEDDDDEPPPPKTISPPVRKPLAPKVLVPAISARIKLSAMPITAQKKLDNSPTINTKAAQEDVFGMFNKEFGQQVEEDLTISAKVYKQDMQRVNIFADESVQGPSREANSERRLSVEEQEREMMEYTNKGIRKPRVYSLMTPITEHDERQFDEKLFTGLSSIQHHRYDTTLGEKSILNRTQDFTYSDHTFAKHSQILQPSICTDVTPKKSAAKRPSTPAKVNTSQLDSDSEDSDAYENPCDPRCADIFPSIVGSILPYLKSLPSLIDCRHDKFDVALDTLPVTIRLKNDASYVVQKVIGKGVNATVYLASQQVAADSDVDSDDESSPPRVCMKLQTSPSPWEFYIQNQLHVRLAKHALLTSLPTPTKCHIYKQSALLQQSYHDKGTLLAHINKHTLDASEQVDELLCIFWAIELIKVVDAVHTAGFIHGDIKSDNILLRGDKCATWDGKYQKDGSSGWNCKGVVLSDWGSAIDLKLFPQTQMFVNSSAEACEDAGAKTEAHECYAYRHGLPYKFNTDYYGIAGIIYTALFGKYMEVTENVFSSDLGYIGDEMCVRVKGVFKRYWQADLWERFFDVMLNAGVYNAMIVDEGVDESGGLEFPIVERIRKVREEMEDFLEINCVKGGKSLKAMLRKIEVNALV